MRPHGISATRRATRLSVTSARLTNRRGATAIVIVVCVVPLVGMLALAVDSGMLYRTRRNAQTAADAGALAYAHERFRGRSASDAETAGRAEATANGYTNGANRSAVAFAAVTYTGGGANAPAILVTVRDTVPALFAGIFGTTRTMVAARGTATWDLATSSACIQVLNPNASDAMYVYGGGTVSAPGCGIAINSTHNTALKVQGSSLVTASSIAVTGGSTTIGNNASISPAPSTQRPPTLNPLASVTTPTPPAGCTETNLVVQPGVPRNLSPGTYCGGLEVKGTVNFAPGKYFFLGRSGGTFGYSLKASSSAVLNGAGVTLINTTRSDYPTLQPFELAGGPTLNLQADTINAGALNGILFYQNPSATPQPIARIRGNAASDLRGTFYMPSATLDLGGTGSMTVMGALIADKLEVSGNGILNIPTVTNATSGYFASKRVTLVE